MTSEVKFGNPWHGVLTPDALLLADATPKTAMVVTGDDGEPSSFPYVFPGAGYLPPTWTPPDTSQGNTYYIKAPNLPMPQTPTELTAIGGEFKNDAILFGKYRRYSPFSDEGMLQPSEWAHFGADGVWRKIGYAVYTISAAETVVSIYRNGRFARHGLPYEYESVQIAQLSLVPTFPANTGDTNTTLLYDARYDGRQILIALRGYWTNDVDPRAFLSTPWNSQDHLGIVSVFRIDIADDAGSATATEIWHREPAVALSSVDRHLVQSQSLFYTGSAFSWKYWENYAGQSQNSNDAYCYIKRLLVAAFDKLGDVVLVEYRYETTTVGSTFAVTGVKFRGNGNTETPVLPAPSPDETSSDQNIYTPSLEWPHTAVETPETITNECVVVANGIVIVEPRPEFAAFNPLLWCDPITNNVADLRNADYGSFCRVGPGAADETAAAYTPIYASYNHRTNAVASSATPIGFV